MSGTVIESDLVIDGNLSSPSGTVCVKGKVSGDITAQSVDVSSTGQVDGALKADSVSVKGRQSGAISCTELSLGSTSEVRSEVTAKTMSSEKGARLVGEVRITGT
jgi:cytoskeletal protein CcmA (bactofilin family)